MTLNEIKCKADELAQTIRSYPPKFTLTGRDGLAILDMISNLADHLSEHVRGAGHDSFGGEA